MEKSEFGLDDSQFGAPGKFVLFGMVLQWFGEVSGGGVEGLANEMHQFIRGQLIGLTNAAVAAEIPILYGGSVKGSNAPELLAKSDIDGALVGGASLQLEDFKSIILSAQN